MKKVLGIFRGFPGLGRVVAGVSLLETLRDKYGYEVKFISYLQGNRYIESRGYLDLHEATHMDYCSIGLLPTNKMGVYIHDTIKQFAPEVIVVDGEPLILHSIKISHPDIKVVTLLNPADVDNSTNDKEAMEFFNAIYSMSDLAIVHGLRRLKGDERYSNMISTNTIIRPEIISVKNHPTSNIYCILGGGTVNVGSQFEESTIRIGKLCLNVASYFPNYTMHIICSSKNIYEALNLNRCTENIRLYEEIIPAEKYYSDACLIITRSGRNTLSELLYLGIPTISYVSGDSYRKVEQFQNIESLNVESIKPILDDISVEEYKITIKGMLDLGKKKNKFIPSNEICIDKILAL